MDLKQVRLLHLIKSLNIGGIEKSTIRYSNILAKELGFVGIYAESGIYNHSNIVQNNIFLCNNVKKVANAFYFIPNLLNLYKCVRCNRINIINYHHRVFTLYVFFLKLFYPHLIKIYTAHSVFSDWQNRLIIADKIIAVSEKVSIDISSYKKNNIIIIPHRVDIPKTIPKKFNGHIKTIGYIGRFEHGKGIFTLLESFETLSKSSSNLHLVFRGDGPEKKAIQNFILTHNLEDKISLLPPCTNDDEIYSEIDVLVLPSHSLEGFGLVIIEAMSRGIPVIATKVGGILDLIEHKKNGVLIAPNDTGALLSGLNEFIVSKQLYKSIQMTGYKYVSEKYRIQMTIDIITNLLININKP